MCDVIKGMNKKRQIFELDFLVLQVKDMRQASKLITCAVILHNLAIEFGDNCEGFDDEEPEAEATTIADDHDGDDQPARPHRERRRNQFLQFFTRT